ncbi:MAG TPA: glycosyltransferase [Pyrinomonadaceae bacterium]
MKGRLRIVVGGYVGLLPAGGVTWDYVQYPVGLAALGHDVYYVEDTRLWPIYQPEGSDWGDASASVAHLRRVMDAFDLSSRWAYRDEASGRTFGMGEEKVREVCRTADVFVNVSCSTHMRDEYRAIPARALIDTDPMFTQIQYLSRQMFTPGEPSLRELVDAHNFHFTFGENVRGEDCRMPDCRIDWRPTRQPVCLPHWRATAPPAPAGGDAAGAAYTTLMNWTAARPLSYDGETWGQKDVEFRRFVNLPGVAPGVALAVAVGQTGGAGEPFPSAEARAAGWRVLDPQTCAPDWRSYGSFIEGSRGEFSVAKETYVKGRTGWFSCRSACYLAAGRAVVTQDTGWSKLLPEGVGLLAFDDVEGAAEALGRVESDPARHSRAARSIAEEHFDSARVLAALLAETGA